MHVAAFLLVCSVGFLAGSPASPDVWQNLRVFRSIENTKYLPPLSEEHSSKTQYLPPQAVQSFRQTAEYLPPEQQREVPPSPQNLIKYIPAVNEQPYPDGSLASGAIEQPIQFQDVPGNVFCNQCLPEQQRSDIEPEAEEPEGYDYPKPTKTFDLPQILIPARTLEQQLPNEEVYVTTTEAAQDIATETTPSVQATLLPEAAIRSARSSLEKSKMGLKLEINPASGPVLIRTLPFNVEPSRTGLESHQIVARQTFSNQRYNGGQPQVQISPPRPGSYDNYRGRPNNVQISPPRPGSYNNFQGRPNNVQISPPRPGSYDNLQTRPIIQISPPRPGPYNNNAQTRPRFN